MAVAGVYDAKLPLQELTAELERLAGLAQAAASMRKTLRIICAVLFFGGIVMLAIVPPVGVLSVFSALLLFIYSFFYKRDLNAYTERVQLLRDGLDVFRP